MCSSIYKPGCIVFIAVALLACSKLNAAASPAPDAGTIIRSLTPQHERPGTLPSPEEATPAETVAEGNGDIQVTARVFRFQGYEGLATEAELQTLVAGYVGKSLDMDALQGVLDTVTARLKSKRWFLAEAYLPEQNLAGGIVRIAIMQGKSDGAIRIKRNKSVRISEKQLEGIAFKGATPGEPLNLRRLERAILLVKQLPGVQARSMISPGSVPGSSVVTFEVNEGPLVSGSAWSDNTANPYTGAWSGNAQVKLNDPSGHGDQFIVRYSGSEGLNQGRVGYSFPVGFGGVWGNLSWTGMNYKLLQELKGRGYEGESSIIEGELSWPIVKRRKTSLAAGVGYAHKHLTDRQESTGLHDKTVKAGNVSLSLTNYDTWLGGGSTTLDLAARYGNFYQPERYDTATGVMGDFSCVTASFSRLQRVSSRLNLSFSCSTQLAFDNLDTSEKFYLGGPYGVRAWPVGEAGGDSGQLLNADLDYLLPLPPAWGKVRLGGFYDAGHVTLNHDRYSGDVTSATGRNDYWLQGAGVSLRWTIWKSCEIHCTWAHTIGDNPGRSSSGANADGKSDSSRFWLQGMVSF